jgi:transposase
MSKSTGSEAIEQAIGAFAKAVALLCAIPVFGQRTAEVIIAEIGTDMSVFPTAGHLVSCAGLCPGHNESAGNAAPDTPRKGSKWLRARTARISARRRPHQTATSPPSTYASKPAAATGRAALAVCHSILAACWYMLQTGEIYHDAGGDYFTRRDPERQTLRLVRQLDALGQTVTFERIAA